MIRLSTLGEINLVADEVGDVDALLSQPKRFALLCYLAIPKPSLIYRRDVLLGVFWPEDSERPRVALRQALSHIRKVLGSEVFTSRGTEEVGLNEDLFWCDVAAFEEAMDERKWSEAVELYRGELLAGFHLTQAPEWERWLDLERRRLASRFAAALEELASDAVAQGDTGAAVEWWDRLAHHDPYDTRYALRLIEALDSAGDTANALRHADRHKAFLLEELQIKPSQEFDEMVERLRSEHRPEYGVAGGERRLGDRRRVPDSHATEAYRERDAGSVEPERKTGVGEEPQATRKSRQWISASITTVVAVVLALVGTYLMMPRDSGVQLDPDHVVVGPFRNATGDQSLDLFGDRVAHWITQGLQHASVPVTPWAMALQARDYVQREATEGRVNNTIKALGEETGAGTVITGAVYLEGDSLQVQVDVSDAWRGRLLGSPPPVSGARDQQQALIGEVQQQVMVFLAASFNERLQGLSPTLMSDAPSFDAFQAFLRGFELHTALEYEEAIPHYRRAIELDSTWAQPAIRLRAALAEAGRQDEQADAMAVLEGLWDSLSEYERAVVESFRAQERGEREQLLEALRREVVLAPGSPSVNNLAIHLNRQNRPREALEQLLSVDLERGWWRHWPPRWDLVCDAHHMLGEYQSELETARRCRSLHPGYDRCLEFQGRALAALGELESLDRLLEEVEDTDEFELFHAVMVPAIETLRANDHLESSQHTARRALQWLDRHPEYEANGTDSRSLYGKLLFLAGRSGEAEAVYDALVEDLPDRLDLRATRGFIAGMGGDRAQASEDLRWLEQYEGEDWAEDVVLWYSGIVAASLGRLERAVDLLSQSHRGFEAPDRIDIFYGPLRDYPPFQEWLEPKG